MSWTEISAYLRCSDELWRTNEHKSNESDHQTSYDQTLRYFLWVLDKTESATAWNIKCDQVRINVGMQPGISS